MNGLLVALSKNREDLKLVLLGSPSSLGAIVQVVLLGLNEMENDVFNFGHLGVMGLHDELLKTFTDLHRKIKENL